VLGARRETARLLVDQLDLAVEPTGRGDVVEAEPERIGEQAVALREVVQQTDADRNRASGHGRTLQNYRAPVLRDDVNRVMGDVIQGELCSPVLIRPSRDKATFTTT
jgi:hypothetical protein